MRNNKAIRIDNAETSTSVAPTLAADGIAVPKQLLSRGFPFVRFATAILTNGGTTPTITTALMLDDASRVAHFILNKGAASGTRTARVVVYGYLKGLMTLTENDGAAVDTLEEVASSGQWCEVFDTGALSDTADFKKAYKLSLGV